MVFPSQQAYFSHLHNINNTHKHPLSSSYAMLPSLSAS
jgi:hypothetical protein